MKCVFQSGIYTKEKSKGVLKMNTELRYNKKGISLKNEIPFL